MTLLFSGILFVGATVYNITNTTSFNTTNHSFVSEPFEQNETITNETEINITLPINDTNITQPVNETQSFNETVEINETKDEINLKDIAEEHNDKLNEKTKKYLKTVEDKKERKDYIIKFKTSIDKDKLTEVSLKKEYSKFNTVKIRGKAEEIGKLLEDYDIEYLELDQDIETLSESIPYGIDKTKAPLVWNLSKGNGVKIAVLDTGVSSHTDLSTAGGTSIISDDYIDNNGHGTSVAGVLSAIINDEGLIGVAPEADIYAVKIMEDSIGDLSDAIEGVEWAIDNNIDIISMSFGMDTYSQIFKEVLQEAYDGEILLIAAAGNTNDDVLYPAAYTDVIAVGAVDENNERASFSPYGFELELVAAGVDINSTDLNNGYTVQSGTSLVAPHVAGVAALIKAYNQSLTNEQIRAKLRNDALDLGSKGKDDYYGYGLVQVNLEAENYTKQNESYFYEIFNITNFRQENEEYIFWLNGTGTIDDVDFSVGLYFIKKYIGDKVIDNKINVTEEGIFYNLVTGYMELVFYDDFTEHGTTGSDAKAWLNGNLTFFNDDGDKTELDAECFDVDWQGSLQYQCYYRPGMKSDCESYSQGLPTEQQRTFWNVCANGQGTCNETLGQNITINTNSLYSEHLDYEVQGIAYYKCDDPSHYYDDEIGPYYIFDRKKAVCTGTPSTSYTIEGRYTTDVDDDWATITTISCPAGQLCDSELDEQIVADKNGTIPDPCTATTDLWITEDDLVMSKQGSYVNFSLTIHSFNISANNLKILFIGVDSGNTRQQEKTNTINIVKSTSSYTTSVKFPLDFDYIEIFVDSTDIVDEETIETNNHIRVRAEAKIDAYLSVSTGLSNVDTKITNYLGEHVNSVSSGSEDVIIAVGDPWNNADVNSQNHYTQANLRWYYDKSNRRIWYEGTSSYKPFNAIVGKFYKSSDGKTRIFIYGHAIDGTVEGVKRLIENKDDYFSNLGASKGDKVIYIKDDDEDAFAITNFLKNRGHYNSPDGSAFANDVEDALNDEQHTVSIYYVKEPGDNTALRIKHVNPGVDEDLQREAGNPVILSQGMHSNLLSWEDFAKDIVENEHRDVWLIEMVGGPNQDEDCGTNCPDYTFSDLKTNYWPALMAAVQIYSGKNSMDYVGYSLGCSAALESLELYNNDGKASAGTLLNGTPIDMIDTPVDTFVAVACPGNFSELTTYMKVFNLTKDKLMPTLDEHTYGTKFRQKMTYLKSYVAEEDPELYSRIIWAGIWVAGFFDDNKMSKNIYEEFYTWINDPTKPDLGKDVSINNLLAIQGRFDKSNAWDSGIWPTSSEDKNSDLIVPTKDMEKMCKNINSNNKYYMNFPQRSHAGLVSPLPGYKYVKNSIKEFLDNKEILTQDLINRFLISNQNDCEPS